MADTARAGQASLFRGVMFHGVISRGCHREHGAGYSRDGLGGRGARAKAAARAQYWPTARQSNRSLELAHKYLHPMWQEKHVIPTNFVATNVRNWEARDARAERHRHVLVHRHRRQHQTLGSTPAGDAAGSGSSRRTAATSHREQQRRGVQDYRRCLLHRLCHRSRRLKRCPYLPMRLPLRTLA